MFSFDNFDLGEESTYLQTLYRVPPLKVLSREKLILARLGVSRRIYISVDSPNLGFPYFNFLVKKNTLYSHEIMFDIMRQYLVSSPLQKQISKIFCTFISFAPDIRKITVT